MHMYTCFADPASGWILTHTNPQWAIPLINYTPLQMTINGVQGGIGNMFRGGGGGGGGGGVVI